MDEHESESRPRDFSALWILTTLSAVEIGSLYLVIAFDTPVSPLVHRMLRNPFGVFVIVMSIVTIMSFGMTAFLWLLERHSSRRSRSEIRP